MPRAKEIRLFLRERQGRRQPDHERHARRQGRGPRRDDQRRPARAGGVHDFDRRLQHLLRAGQQAAARGRSRDRGQPAQARKGGRRHARLHDESAAGVGALGRQVLDARHDGHDSQPRPQRRSGRRLEGAHQERPVRVRQLPPLHADVRQRRARDSQGGVRARVRARQDREERQDGHRPRRGRAAGSRPGVQGRRAEADRQAVSAEPDGSTADGAKRRVPLVEQRARQRVPAHLRHPGFDRHRRQRADDGVRQHRRSIGHGRGLHAQSCDRRQGVLRRVPDQRPGRRRRRRHPHAAADRRAREGDAEGVQATARYHLEARAQLQGHPGLRIHDPGRNALHAADPQRQAHGLCGGHHRNRHGQGEADHAEGGDPPRRPGSALAAAGARVRSERVEGAAGRDARPAGFARRGVRQGGVFIRNRGGMVEPRRARGAGAPRNGAGRHSRHVGVAGHPDGDRRHDVACGRRRPPDGQAVDRRRGRAADRRARQDASP